MSQDTTPNPSCYYKAMKPGSNTAQNEKPKISKLEQMKIDREKKKQLQKEARTREIRKEKAKNQKRDSSKVR